MSALGATSPAGSNLAALIAANVPSSPPSNPPPSALADTAAGNDRGPPTNIQLSDKVKSILARAETDQAVADRLKSFVQKQRTGGTGSAPTEAGSKTDIAVAFQHLSGSSDQGTGQFASLLSGRAGNQFFQPCAIWGIFRFSHR